MYDNEKQNDGWPLVLNEEMGSRSTNKWQVNDYKC